MLVLTYEENELSMQENNESMSMQNDDSCDGKQLRNDIDYMYAIIFVS